MAETVIEEAAGEADMVAAVGISLADAQQVAREASLGHESLPPEAWAARMMSTAAFFLNSFRGKQGYFVQRMIRVHAPGFRKSGWP